MQGFLWHFFPFNIAEPVSVVAMCDVVTTLRNMPIIIVNLQKDENRRTHMVQFMQKLWLCNYEFLKAIDGTELLARGGRARRSKNLWTLTYETGVANQTVRISHKLRASKLSKCGGTNVWAQHACAMSHHAAIAKAQLFAEVRVLQDLRR